MLEKEYRGKWEQKASRHQNSEGGGGLKGRSKVKMYERCNPN